MIFELMVSLCTEICSDLFTFNIYIRQIFKNELSKPRNTNLLKFTNQRCSLYSSYARICGVYFIFEKPNFWYAKKIVRKFFRVAFESFSKNFRKFYR